MTHVFTVGSLRRNDVDGAMTVWERWQREAKAAGVEVPGDMATVLWRMQDDGDELLARMHAAASPAV